MTSPPPAGSGSSGDSDEPFDPYRFGHPDVPPAPEYAPPGYRPPPPADQPASGQEPSGQAPSDQPPPYGSTPYGPSPYGPPPYDQAPYGQAPYGQAPYGQPPHGQAPYGQAPYGPPPYPYNYGAPGQFTAPRNNGKAVAGLVLGILAILMFWTTFLDAIFVIVALVFSIIGLNDSKLRGTGRGNAIAGIVCAIVGAALAIAFTVLVVHLSNECSGTGSQNSSSYRQCVKDKL